ncbi:uncharacterized protein PRCAT00003474001 [Priceomyces carsonii]|uniref:uncharacterized protein n=1 Tax=Priceomyces carsonii TaxID=28549 RepID=UPI002EDB11B7|nr:unnamed protein product [Priceomyces carsonii]
MSFEKDESLDEGKNRDVDALESHQNELSEQITNEDVKLDHFDASAAVIKDRGVYRVEALKTYLDTIKNGLRMKIIFGTSIMICAWAIALDSGVTYSLQPWATSSYQEHSMGLGALSIANAIITSISKPVFARISNVVSRPTTYILSILFYAVGYIIVAASNTVSAYIVGLAVASAGSSGIDFLNSLIVADMSSLKWRGFVTSMLSTPYIINTWYAGYIVQDLGAQNWRWGYGMFTIIMPVVVAPATIIMVYYEGRAQKNLSPKQKADYKASYGFKGNWKTLLWRVIVEVDLLGLVLLGFGFALVLLPLSLYQSAENGWRNPSIIAMMVVGGVILILFFLYEFLLAPYPITPKRVLNRTLICSILIDFFYQLGGMIPLVYLSSFAYIVQDWSDRNWTYYNNTLTMSLCVFGVVAGIFYRITHRYKVYQIFGIVLSILGLGIMIEGKNARSSTLALVWSQILDGMGGGFNVVGSGVALQASVPHRDMSISMSILSLWSYIGQSIGSAISVAIWEGKMYNALRKHLPSSVLDTEVASFFADITVIRGYDFKGEIRQGAVRAYKEVNYYFYAIALGLQFIRLIAALFQSNYFLGDQQNAVESAIVNPNSEASETEHKDEEEWYKTRKGWKGILLDVW